MRLEEKIKKLIDGQAFASITRHVRSLFHRLFFPSPIKPKRIIASIEGHNRFHEICDRYGMEDPGEGPPKFLNLKRWIRRNAKRVRELRLDDQKRQRVLDLGCGPGYFLYICRCLGHDVLGIDIDEVPMYGELTQLLEVPRVIWRIEPFVPLPDLGQFDVITSFLTCFNEPIGPGLWGIAEWDFFLEDIRRHVLPNGRLWFELNRQSDGQPYSPALKRFFESRGARIDLYRVMFTSDRVARSSA